MTRNLRNKEERVSKRDNLKEDDSVSGYLPGGSEDSVSAYVPSPTSEEDDTLNISSSKVDNVAGVARGGNAYVEEAVEEVPDNVIICGQRSLHCKNAGNLFFKDLIHAAVVLIFKHGGDVVFDKEKATLLIKTP